MAVAIFFIHKQFVNTCDIIIYIKHKVYKI